MKSAAVEADGDQCGAWISGSGRSHGVAKEHETGERLRANRSRLKMPGVSRQPRLGKHLRPIAAPMSAPEPSRLFAVTGAETNALLAEGSAAKARR